MSHLTQSRGVKTTLSGDEFTDWTVLGRGKGHENDGMKRPPLHFPSKALIRALPSSKPEPSCFALTGPRSLGGK